MYIETNEDWEIENDVVKELNPPGTKFYHMVKFFGNFFLFHLDLWVSESKDEEMKYCQRFLISDIQTLLDILLTLDSDEFEISLQSRKCDNKNDEYDISTLTKIIKAYDSANQISYIYVCINGQRYIESALADTESELTNKETVYFQTKKI